MGIFKFVAPDWANSKTRITTAEEALKRAKDLASSYYALGTQTHVHAMIEWCGVMGEYVKFLEYIYQTQGIRGGPASWRTGVGRPRVHGAVLL
jgi:hypothetical protein